MDTQKKFKIRTKTKLEVALYPIIKELGRMPTANELTRFVGGNPYGWGRILNGLKPSGDYHAILKILKKHDLLFDAQKELLGARYRQILGEKTRKGGMVPHKILLHSYSCSNDAKRISLGHPYLDISQEPKYSLEILSLPVR